MESVFDKHETGRTLTPHFPTVKWSKSKPQIAVARLKATIRATMPTEAEFED
jgi:hypothetical protein